MRIIGKHTIESLLSIDETDPSLSRRFRSFVEDVKRLYYKTESPLIVKSRMHIPRINYYLDKYLGKGNLDIGNLDLAVAIYNWMADNVQYQKNNRRRNMRNSRETFRDEKGDYMEMAMLYVGLARQEGLYANVVKVQEDYLGAKTSHPCAAVRLRRIVNSVRTAREDVLVDPAYKMFGVCHRKFRVMTDEEVKRNYILNQHDEMVDIHIMSGDNYRLVA